jgi:3-oxoacyl-[acyl-carrier protein] reductase
MNRPESQTTLRPRPLTDGFGRGGTRLVGKVVLIDASMVEEGVQRAHRYANEGADVALAYHMPCDEIFIVQRQIEALGNRCVLYEIDLEDEWNCGLVVQSTAECLGPIDLIVNRRGHVHVVDRQPCTAADLLDAVTAHGSLPAKAPNAA